MPPKYYGAAAQQNPNKKFFIDKKLVMMLAGGLLVLILIAVFFGVLGAVSNGPRNELQKLIAQEQSLIDFLDTNAGDVKSQALLKITADAQILISSNQQTLTEQLTSKFNLKEVDSSFISAAADTSSADQLDTAKANGQFDRTIFQLIQTKLNNIIQQAQKVASANSTLKTYTDQTESTVQAIAGELTALKF